MTEIFLYIVNMSITATILADVVLLASASEESPEMDQRSSLGTGGNPADLPVRRGKPLQSDSQNVLGSSGTIDGGGLVFEQCAGHH